ncbi:hypothetical protein VB776_08580 [Arcicella sp. DC2W]|uniref:Uncharacterized protein n=1 Tax=Arcicella gelida TaxID=2984195 RepID=A0ABU5S3C3_9BACT|nr:hypothetical protein [Arcicella sp. DC2W]MEA5402967.1 hypothetical protein [Arcicella sp. DC2W]
MLEFYIDLITTLCFLAFITFLERRGIVTNEMKYSSQLVLKFNLLIYRNNRLYVLPYFYAITLLNDLETVYVMKPHFGQILYFTIAFILQGMLWLRMQKGTVTTFYKELKFILRKLHLKYFNIPTKNATDEQKEKLLQEKASTHFTFQEIRFLLNSCALPVLFIISNAYFLAKLFSYFLNHKY